MNRILIRKRVPYSQNHPMMNKKADDERLKLMDMIKKTSDA